MRPLPEVEAAAGRLQELTGEVDLLAGLRLLSEVAGALVPSLVGLSLTVVFDGEPFTLTATSEETASLDAVQYLDGGPCLESSFRQERVAVADLLDETRWQLYRDVAPVLGVRSSLSLPLGGSAGPTPGAINLYARDPRAFDGIEDLLAEVFETPTQAFVRNADLSFATLDAARRLPEQLEERARLDQAAGVLASISSSSVDEARTRLQAAAERAGTPLSTVAGVILAMDAE